MANPNPSPATRFKPGNSGNPGGKTSEHQKRDLAAADLASQITFRLLSAVQEKLDDGESALDLLSSDTLRLIKDAQDRAHGTPKQAVEATGANGGPMTLQVITGVPRAED